MAIVADKPETQVPQAALKPSKAQLEANIRMSERWRQAVLKGTFPGQDVEAVAELLGFLAHQHQIALETYEAESLQHPDWGRPSDLPPGGKA